MRYTVFVLSLSLVLCAPALAQTDAEPAETPAEAPTAEAEATLTAREIMNRVEHINDADDESSTMDMTLTNKRGQTRNRVLQSWSKQTEGDNENQLVRFEKPNDVSGVGLLTWEHDDRDDDQWLYLPALKKVRRISTADQADSFMGTDFSYEDMRSEKLDEHTYTLLREEETAGRQCWVIEAIASTEKQKAESGYSRRVLWIDQATYLALKAEYYDKKGELLKEYTASDLQEVEPGMWRANRLFMHDVQKDHRTELLFNDRTVNAGVDDDTFTERELKRGR